MIKMIKRFFSRRKMRVIAFGDIETKWTDEYNTTPTVVNFAVIFFENDNGERNWIVSGGDNMKTFDKTSYPTQCEIWKHTGLLPKWAKDPLAEKLCRDLNMTVLYLIGGYLIIGLLVWLTIALIEYSKKQHCGDASIWHPVIALL